MRIDGNEARMDEDSLAEISRENTGAGAAAPPPQASSADGNKTKLFVGSLSLGTTDTMVREMFEPFGDLVECKIIVESVTRVSKGFAYVTYRRPEDAGRAVAALNGAPLDGRNIKVEFAKEQFQSWGAQWHIANRRGGGGFEDKPPVSNPSTYKELPSDKANRIPFVEFCAMLDSVRLIRGGKQKLELIFGEHSKLPGYLKGASWYPIMRLILPDLDRERPRYGLKAQAMAKLFVKALGLSARDNPDAIRLINWKDPTVAQQHLQHHNHVSGEENQQIGAVGDFANVLRDVLEKRGYVAGSSKRLSVGEINSKLDLLHNANSQTEKEDVLIGLLQSCNAMEMYWLTRIVLKDLNCGLRFESVLKRYHKDAIEAMDSHGDLRRCIAELSDPTVSRAYTVELFSTVSPMLARVVKMDQATEKLGDFVIEPKMDGDRMLVHIDRTNPDSGPKVMLFTRNGNDYTTRYGSKQLFDSLLSAFDCRRCIIDGEMLSWDDDQERVLEFGQTTTVANEMNDPGYSGRRWLYYVCFDALLIDDGRNLTEQSCVITGEPLRVRRSRLQSIFTPIARKVELVEPLVVTDPDLDNRHRIVMQELDKMITIKGEGLILKSLASPYVPGETGRKQGLWVKVKPEHVSGLQEELDCLILGGYYSEGARRSSKHELDPSVFLVGVPASAATSTTTTAAFGPSQASHHQPSSSSKRQEFFCLAKVGTGYTFAELEEIRRHLRPHLIRTGAPDAPRPKHFVMPVRAGDFPDVWIPPEHSIVLQVTGSELVPCDWFSANYTLRFPRCTRIRWDKSAENCTLYSEVVRFAPDSKAGTGLHGARRAVDISRAEAGRGKRAGLLVGDVATKRRKKRVEEILLVGGTDHLRDVAVEENAPLEGWSFFVFPAAGKGEEASLGPIRDHPEIQSQEDLERFIKRKGGRVVKTVSGSASSSPKTNFMLLASEGAIAEPSKQMLNVFSTNVHDIVRIEFVIECCDGKRFLNDLRFSDYLFLSKETRKTMAGLDAFGDHFTEKSDLLSLERCMRDSGAKGQEVSTTALAKPKKQTTANQPRADAGDKSQKKSSNDGDDTFALKIYLELSKDEDDPLATPVNVMRGVIAYFYPSASFDKDVETKLAMATVRLHGGIVRDKLDEFTTHVFFSTPPNADEEAERHLRDQVGAVRDDIARRIRLNATPLWREPMMLRTSFILHCCKDQSLQSLTWDLIPDIRKYIIDS